MPICEWRIITIHKWDEVKLNSGDKIVFVYDDGMSASLALMADNDVLLDAEEATEIEHKWLKGAIWYKLPDDYPIYFMELNESDWY